MVGLVFVMTVSGPMVGLGFRLVRSVVGSTEHTPVHPGWGVTLVLSERCFVVYSDLAKGVRLCMLCDFSSSILFRRGGPSYHLGRPVLSSERLRQREFQNLPVGEWERFRRAQAASRMQGQPAAAGSMPPPPPVPRVVPVQGRSFDRFLGARPPQFAGAPDAITTSNWLMRMEDILQRIACAPEFRVSHATYQLEDAAKF
ncbi:hypothetical protein Dimus_018426 [Dionaea muscipula]